MPDLARRPRAHAAGRRRDRPRRRRRRAARATFTEVHPLPGRDLMPVVDDPAVADRDRAVYLMTRDNMLEGDTGAVRAWPAGSAAAEHPPAAAAHPGRRPTSARTSRASSTARSTATSGSSCAPSTTRPPGPSPGVRHLAADGPAGRQYRTVPLPDQWELYDLDDDPIEVRNRAHDPAHADVLDQLRAPAQGRAAPPRSPSATSRGPTSPAAGDGPTWCGRPARPRACAAAGPAARHAPRGPATPWPSSCPAGGRWSIATNHGTLDIGKPTGVFASELTVPYYASSTPAWTSTWPARWAA